MEALTVFWLDGGMTETTDPTTAPDLTLVLGGTR
jgi:hypothetical protein